MEFFLWSLALTWSICIVRYTVQLYSTTAFRTNGVLAYRTFILLYSEYSEFRVQVLQYSEYTLFPAVTVPEKQVLVTVPGTPISRQKRPITVSSFMNVGDRMLAENGVARERWMLVSM